jgi:hypothetical protein
LNSVELHFGSPRFSDLDVFGVAGGSIRISFDEEIPREMY